MSIFLESLKEEVLRFKLFLSRRIQDMPCSPRMFRTCFFSKPLAFRIPDSRESLLWISFWNMKRRPEFPGCFLLLQGFCKNCIFSLMIRKSSIVLKNRFCLRPFFQSNSDFFAPVHYKMAFWIWNFDSFCIESFFDALEYF